MLDDILALLADMGDTVVDTCGPCADTGPSAAPTSAGSAGSAGSSGNPGDPGDDERDWHEEPDHEARWQRENARSTAKDLIWEYVTSPTGNLGKVLGPLTVVASGSEVLGDGISTITEANRRREEILYEQTGGEMGQPPSGPSEEPAGDGGGGPDDDPTPEPVTEARDDSGRRRADQVMEDIRVNQQFKDAGNRNDAWKDWR